MRSLRAVAVSVVLGSLLVGAPAEAARVRAPVPRAAAKPPKPPRTTCQVENAATGQKGTALQPLIDAAAPGAQLQVKGTCVGANVVERDLVLAGKSTKTSPVPTLDGGDFGSVVFVKGAHLTVRDLKLTNGIGTPDPTAGGRFGGGIESWGGDITLTGTTNVTGNHAADGGGGVDIYQGIEGFTDVVALTMSGGARVADNTVGADANPDTQDVWREQSNTFGGTWTIADGTVGKALIVSMEPTFTDADVESVDATMETTHVGSFTDSTIGALEIMGIVEVDGGSIASLGFTGKLDTTDAVIGALDGTGALTVHSGSVGSIVMSFGAIQLPGGVIQFSGETNVEDGDIGSIASNPGTLTRVSGGTVASIAAGDGAIAEVRDGARVTTLNRDGNCPVVVAFGALVNTLNIVSGPQNVLIGADAHVDTVNDYVCGGGLQGDSLNFVGTYNPLATGCST